MFAIRLSPLLCRFSVSPPDYIVMAASRVPTWKIWNASGSVQLFCVSPLSLHPIRNPRGAVVNVTGPHPCKLKKLASFFSPIQILRLFIQMSIPFCQPLPKNNDRPESRTVVLGKRPRVQTILRVSSKAVQPLSID